MKNTFAILATNKFSSEHMESVTWSLAYYDCSTRERCLSLDQSGIQETIVSTEYIEDEHTGDLIDIQSVITKYGAVVPSKEAITTHALNNGYRILQVIEVRNGHII